MHGCVFLGFSQAAHRSYRRRKLYSIILEAVLKLFFMASPWRSRDPSTPPTCDQPLERGSEVSAQAPGLQTERSSTCVVDSFPLFTFIYLGTVLLYFSQMIHPKYFFSEQTEQNHFLNWFVLFSVHLSSAAIEQVRSGAAARFILRLCCEHVRTNRLQKNKAAILYTELLVNWLDGYKQIANKQGSHPEHWTETQNCERNMTVLPACEKESMRTNEEPNPAPPTVQLTICH